MDNKYWIIYWTLAFLSSPDCRALGIEWKSDILWRGFLVEWQHSVIEKVFLFVEWNDSHLYPSRAFVILSCFCYWAFFIKTFVLSPKELLFFFLEKENHQITVIFFSSSEITGSFLFLFFWVPFNTKGLAVEKKPRQTFCCVWEMRCMVWWIFSVPFIPLSIFFHERVHVLISNSRHSEAINYL